MLVMLTLHPDAVPVPTVIVPAELPTVGHHAVLQAGAGMRHLVVVVVLMWSAKFSSSAVTMFRRSDFIEEMYAFSFVLANFGIAMAARMPMITTTIKSSIRVKPLRFIGLLPVAMRLDGRLPQSSLSNGRATIGPRGRRLSADKDLPASGAPSGWEVPVGGVADCEKYRNTIYQGLNSLSVIVVELEPSSSFIVTASGRPTLGETQMSMITFWFSRHTPRSPLTPAYWHVDSTLNELVLPLCVVVQ